MTAPVTALPLPNLDGNPARKKRVLLLDTSQTKRDLRADMMRKLGIDVDTAADVLEDGSPAFAEKLRRATPHWTRHTHATHLLDGGAELTSVRDNLRHSSLATTSMYLHADDERRAKQVADRFAAPRS